MRAILDADVIIAALLAPGGPPAKVLRTGQKGASELIASPLLLAELERALAYPELGRHIPAGDAAEAIGLVERLAPLVDDLTEPPLVRSPDPGDDYLIAPAATIPSR